MTSVNAIFHLAAAIGFGFLAFLWIREKRKNTFLQRFLTGRAFLTKPTDFLASLQSALGLSGEGVAANVKANSEQMVKIDLETWRSLLAFANLRGIRYGDRGQVYFEHRPFGVSSWTPEQNKQWQTSLGEGFELRLDDEKKGLSHDTK